MSMSDFYRERVVLITGAATGIGHSSAIEFAKVGATVVVADWNEVEGQATVDTILRDGGQAKFIRVDVSDSASVKAMVDTTVDRFGRLDCAFNNAGIMVENSKTADLDEDIWDRTVAVNMKGVWLCLKHELPVMVALGKGAIVNTASGNAFRILPNSAAYTASKFGVVGLTRMAAVEYGPQGIRVNAIVPGAIRTPMFEAAVAENPWRLERVKETRPLGHLSPVDPVEIAKAAMWLCSDESRQITGHCLPVDGGYLAAA